MTDIATLTVRTDRDGYATGDHITISGKLTTTTINQPLLIQVLDPREHRARIDQVEAAADGTYSYGFEAHGLMNVTGRYKVLVSYKTTEARTTFNFTSTSEENWKTYTIKVDDRSYLVKYKITGGSVQSILPNEGIGAIIITIDSHSDGILDLRLPRNVIDSRKGDDGKSGADEEFAVFVDEVVGTYDEIEATVEARTISIGFENRAETIEIVGTAVLATTSPKFVIITPDASSKTSDAHQPNPLNIKAGSTVIWINHDAAAHTITSGKGPRDPDVGKAFDSSPQFNPLIVPEGGTFSTKFYKPGRYHYFCQLHPNEVGIVNVQKTRTKRQRKSIRSPEAVWGHFFFVDIVGLSDPRNGGTESQIKKITALHNATKSCAAYRSKNEKYINLTGDGMVIGFLTGPTLPLELAIQLHKKLSQYNKNKKQNNKVKVRIGIDSAPILNYKDILGNENVWGDGIVYAHRAMERADADDIFLTSRAAEALKQFEGYRDVIHLLGRRKIKHGLSIRLYYAYGKGFGKRRK